MLVAPDRHLAHDFKHDREGGAHIYLTGDFDVATHLLYNRLADWEAQAPSRWVRLSVLLQVVEVDKEATQLIRGNPTAKVLYAQLELNVARWLSTRPFF